MDVGRSIFERVDFGIGVGIGSISVGGNDDIGPTAPSGVQTTSWQTPDPHDPTEFEGIATCDFLLPTQCGITAQTEDDHQTVNSATCPSVFEVILFHNNEKKFNEKI